ncbi:sulfatase-like hydrolase/transferase [Microbulbifer agarilyticus]|uniref:sulfatase-like hydrolase/transferase n=1 Tax=Microbulbifer agarilyticus TaxID=260552 RepID=UPI001C950632|nr:sulfatase-like hydrolase/transferase [Microbulbifer agarilyticus]MBY6210940.1 sulfatase-like hydrolase/transferase [Microbulbifer agarilyticus]
MTVHRILKYGIHFAAAAIVSVLASHVAAAEKSVKPNFVLILADDLGYGDLGYTGSTQIRTPNIDALAASGAIIEQGYVSAPVCGPSRAGLMTGRNQVNFGFDNNPVKPVPQFKPEYFGLPVGEKTIADRLAELGYINGLMGKWHLGDQEQFRPSRRGFHEVWTYPVGGHDYFRSEPDGEGYLSPLESNFKTPDPITYLTDDTANESIDFIRRHKDKPFFLYASFNAPHTPLQATEEDLALYQHIADEKRRTYAAMVHNLDVNVGRIVRELKDQGLYDNTMVVFLSDNGGPIARNNPWTLNAPYRGSKGGLLEGGIRVPFLVSWPQGIEAGLRYEYPVTALDITPTFVELAGGAIAESDKLDGSNVYPYLAGKVAGNPNDDMKWRFTISASIREDEWKLVRLPDRLPMLFNVKADPSEQNDVAHLHRERVVRMLKALGDWDVSAPHPLYLEGEQWRRVQLDNYDVEYRLTQPN